MGLDKWDWAMIIGMILIVVGFVVMAFMIGSGDGGSSGSDCFFTYSGSVATPVCT